MLLSTFAKAVSPSLRLGFIVAPLPAATALATQIERERGHVSWPVQKIVHALLACGELDKHLRKVRRHYRAMRDMVQERLASCAEDITLRGEDGGLHVMVAGRRRVFDVALRQALRSQGVTFSEIAEFSDSPVAESRGFLLGYGHMNLDELTHALDILTMCIERCSAGRAHHS